MEVNRRIAYQYASDEQHRGKRRIRFLPHADSFIVIWIRNQNSQEDSETLNFGII